MLLKILQFHFWKPPEEVGYTTGSPALYPCPIRGGFPQAPLHLCRVSDCEARFPHCHFHGVPEQSVPFFLRSPLAASRIPLPISQMLFFWPLFPLLLRTASFRQPYGVHLQHIPGRVPGVLRRFFLRSSGPAGLPLPEFHD